MFGTKWLTFLNSYVLYGCTFALFFLISGNLCAQIPTDTLYLGSHKDGNYPLHQHLYVLETPNKTNAQTIGVAPLANFKRMYPKEVLDIGMTENYHWLVFTLKNNTLTDATYYLQLHYPAVNFVYAYAKTAEQYQLIGKTGFGLPFKDRSYEHFDVVLPLHLRAGASASYLVMVDKIGESLNLRPTLQSSSAFQKEENYQYLFYGIIAGVMLTNIIVNLFFYLSLRQKIHIQYAAYVFAILCWVFDAMNYQLFFYNYPSIPTISEPIMTSLALVMMSYLIISFLELNKQNCSFLKAIFVVRYLSMLLIPLSYVAFITYGHLIWTKEAYLYALLLIALCAIVVFLASAIQQALQKNKLGWFYLASASYLAYAIISYGFYILGYSNNSSLYQVPNDIQIGVLVETIIIFLGIIYRYNLYKKDKMLLLAKINLQQQETAQQIVSAQEEERKRLAQDLHDDLGATLSTLLLHTSNLPEDGKWDQRAAAEHQSTSVAISKKALADLRLISHNLLPKDFSHLGIFRILQNKIEELNHLGAIDFRLVTSGSEEKIQPIVSITIYRIINELISNVIKHSLASYCNVELILDQENLVLIIEDNGTGINLNEANNGIGLKNIKSRVEFLGGLLNIDGNSKGTSTIIEIPLNHHTYDA